MYKCSSRVVLWNVEVHPVFHILLLLLLFLFFILLLLLLLLMSRYTKKAKSLNYPEYALLKFYATKFHPDVF